MESPSFTEALARICARRPGATIGLWFLGLVLSVGIIATLLGSALTTEIYFTNNPESKRASQLLEERFEAISGPQRPNETVIVRAAGATVEDVLFRDYVQQLDSAIRALGPEVIENGLNVYQSGDQSLVSADRQITLLPYIVKDSERQIGHVVDILKDTDRPSGFEVYIVGNASVDREFAEVAERDLNAEFRIGVPAAMVILAIVFASLTAVIVPVILAFASIAIALALTALIGQSFQFSFFVTNMITSMGLAVGIDSSLLFLSRFREERRKGLPKLEAIAVAGATSNRTVFFSGMMVALALMGMLIVPFTIFRSLGGGAILVVLISVMAALTLLPAIVSVLGDKVNSLRLPVIGREHTSQGRGGFWNWVSRRVMGAPVVSLVIAAGLLMGAATFAFDLNIGFAGVSTLPDRFQAKQGFKILEEQFHYDLGGRVIVVINGDIASPQVQSGLARLQESLKSDGGFVGESSLQAHPERNIARVVMSVAGEPSGQQAEDTVQRLRSSILPQVFAGAPAEALVTGNIAENVDFFDLVNSFTPTVFVLVLGLSLILLTTLFRSIVVPVKAIIMNLLSVGAAYGFLVLVFQKGYGAGILGFQQVATIEAWIPIFLFSVLFGLSMDYHVFLLSRVRERYNQTLQNEEAVAFGLRSTGGIITGAALIMVGVFSGFASGELVMF